MKTTFKRFAAALGLVLIGTILTAKASAECLSSPTGRYADRLGVRPVAQRWNGNHELGTASAKRRYLFGGLGKDRRI
jgi:hypothetical protein